MDLLHHDTRLDLLHAYVASIYLPLSDDYPPCRSILSAMAIMDHPTTAWKMWRCLSHTILGLLQVLSRVLCFENLSLDGNSSTDGMIRAKGVAVRSELARLSNAISTDSVQGVHVLLIAHDYHPAHQYC
jgi:hypothetical protein